MTDRLFYIVIDSVDDGSVLMELIAGKLTLIELLLVVLLVIVCWVSILCLMLCTDDRNLQEFAQNPTILPIQNYLQPDRGVTIV